MNGRPRSTAATAATAATAVVPAVLVALATLLSAAARPAAAGAQGIGVVVPAGLVERDGASDVAIDRRLAQLLARDPIVLAGDTLVAAADTLRGPVLVLDATLVLEGVVAGDLVLVDAGAFVRPGARVDGDLVNVAGGLYRSEISSVRGRILDLPLAEYRVVRYGDRLVIEATGSPKRLTLDGPFGLRVPTYDRVNGLTAAVGGRYRLPRLGSITPSVHAYGGWMTQRGEPAYGASARLRWLAMALEAGYDSGWGTNDDWIAGDLSNSLNYLWDGDDFRDYHAVDVAWVRLFRELGDAEKRFYGVVSLTGRVEDAASLPGGEPWHLLGDSARTNPAIDDGRTSSVVAAFDVEWHGRETWFEGGVEYEAARAWLDGDYAFDRVAVRGEWAMRAIADHTLEIDFFVQQPLGGGVLPRQEWSFVGGSRTLQTVDFARYRGDRVVFVETIYTLPLPERVAVPILGAPDVQLLHGAGMAWTDGEDPAFEQELGVRVLFFGLDFRYMLDPTDPSVADLDIGINVDFGGSYPWQR